MTHNWTNESTRIWHWSDSPKTTVIIMWQLPSLCFFICSWYFLKQNSRREQVLISLSLPLLELSPLELITKKYVILFIFKFLINVVGTIVNSKGKSLGYVCFLEEYLHFSIIIWTTNHQPPSISYHHIKYNILSWLFSNSLNDSAHCAG